MQARRLRSREQLQAVLAGAKVARTEHFVMHRMILETANPSSVSAIAVAALFPGGGLWLGAMIPKRWARRAVTRNLIKRQIYDLAGHLGSNLPPAAYLVRLCKGFDKLRFRSAASGALRCAVRSEIEALFNKAMQAKVLA